MVPDLVEAVAVFDRLIGPRKTGVDRAQHANLVQLQARLQEPGWQFHGVGVDPLAKAVACEESHRVGKITHQRRVAPAAPVNHRVAVDPAGVVQGDDLLQDGIAAHGRVRLAARTVCGPLEPTIIALEVADVEVRNPKPGEALR